MALIAVVMYLKGQSALLPQTFKNKSFLLFFFLLLLKISLNLRNNTILSEQVAVILYFWYMPEYMLLGYIFNK